MRTSPRITALTARTTSLAEEARERGERVAARNLWKLGDVLARLGQLPRDGGDHTRLLVGGVEGIVKHMHEVVREHNLSKRDPNTTHDNVRPRLTTPTEARVRGARGRLTSDLCSDMPHTPS